MDIFFDTTVLVAASEQSHPHYAQAWPAMKRVATGQDRGFMGTHSIAEVYASLTRLPVHPRIQPLEAVRIIDENIVAHFTVVALDKEDYVETLTQMGNGGWSGAKIYDGLLLRCAAKCHVARIYTFNLDDFRRLAPPALLPKIGTP